MPSPRIYKNLGLHRQAGIALYRALLQQCRAVPLLEPTQKVLQNVIRNRFWAHRNQAGARFIKLAFHSGYKALDLLDASASGDAASTLQVTDYLKRLPKSVIAAPNKTPRRAKKRERGSEAYETPPEKKVFAVYPRPESKVPHGPSFRDKDGIRKVPFLVNSQGFPFIRIKRHQPKNLSRVLRQKRDKYWQRSNILRFVEDYFQPLATHEDQWDRLVKINVPNYKGGGGERSFAEEMNEAWEDASERWNGMSKQQIELANKMRNVVQMERKLAEEERDQAVKKGLIKEGSARRDWPTSQW